LGERIQKPDRADNFEKSYPTKLNLEDRKEDIFVGTVPVVQARSCAGFHP
jgi:hypothetical protein